MQNEFAFSLKKLCKIADYAAMSTMRPRLSLDVTIRVRLAGSAKLIFRNVEEADPLNSEKASLAPKSGKGGALPNPGASPGHLASSRRRNTANKPGIGKRTRSTPLNHL